MLLTSTTVNGAVSNDSNNNITMSVGNTVIANVNSSGIFFESGKKAIYTGAVLQVVQGVDTTFRSTTSNWPVASGFGTSITPTSATSKILVTMNIQFYLNAGGNTNKIGILGIYRSSTYLMGQRTSVNPNYAAGDFFLPVNLVYLDSPNTTSSVTYNLYWGRYDTANFPNTLNMGDGLPAVGGTQPSTITLLEIAA